MIYAEAETHDELIAVIGTNVNALAVSEFNEYEELIDAEANEVEISIVNSYDEVNAYDDVSAFDDVNGTFNA